MFHMSVLPSTKEQHEAVLKFLKEDLATCNIISVLIQGNLCLAPIYQPYIGSPFQGEYYGIFDENECLIGLAVHFWTGGLVTIWPEDKINDLRLLLSSLKRPISRIEASPVIVQAVHDVVPGLESVLVNITLFLENRGPVKKMSDGSRVSPPCPEDFSQLVEWRLEFLVESQSKVQSTPDLSMLRQRAETYINEMTDLIRVLRSTSTQEPLCMLTLNAVITSEAAMIGNVYVTPRMRRQGLARELVRGVLLELEGRGIRRVCLYTSNPVAEALYLSLGFTRSQPLAVLS